MNDVLRQIVFTVSNEDLLAKEPIRAVLLGNRSGSDCGKI
jgi:hypothetical protein